ncbi:ATP-binding protein [Piscibacillus sp. B03]|uniref:ATP-binding protein n=1 Tax=Piscibacillus sp. B03 TaxID=3457430 RepID=UPI003FCC5DAE
MKNSTGLQDLLKSLRLTEAANELSEFLTKAETQNLSYQAFLLEIMNYEQTRREEKLVERRMKWASFPFHKILQDFNLEEQPSLSKRQFNQLIELNWIDQLYNLILLGPPGTGNYR